MMADLLALLPQWGPWLIAAAAFLSGLMIPLPSATLLLTAGALSGTGHLHLPILFVAGTVAAILGDVAGFSLARKLGPWLNRAGTRRARLMERARDYIHRHGATAIFLGRWLITPIGPPSNYVSGASGLSLGRFLIPTVAGEATGAALHLLIGHLFGRQFREMEGAAVKAIAVAVVIGVILFLLRKAAIRRRRTPASPS